MSEVITNVVALVAIIRSGQLLSRKGEVLRLSGAILVGIASFFPDSDVEPSPSPSDEGFIFGARVPGGYAIAPDQIVGGPPATLEGLCNEIESEMASQDEFAANLSPMLVFLITQLVKRIIKELL